MIISHTLEHIHCPEAFINELLRVLKPNGVISIALPCDNGLLWRLGRFYNKFFNDRMETLKSEISPEIRISMPEDKNGWEDAFFLSVNLGGLDTLDPSTEQMQISWYSEHLNKYVNFLRPLIKQLPEN